MRYPFRNLSTAVLCAALLVGGAGTVSPASAERVSPDRTNARHMSRAPEKPDWRMKRVTFKKSTIYENAAKRGLLMVESGPLRQVAEYDKRATDACRDGRFNRFGGGFVRIGGRTYRAARSRDIRRPRNFEVQPGVYIFSREGSTRCTVHRAERE
ncbi:hypothetical protein NUH88_14475 [Nisaea acidiphila]|uniref:Secreted protein n=1 Tax=Nisaea acidiphila TaxID=1862145 RepID=A0A9J7ALU3_9PROT|nr:hypothetical protein [Nisaea acidiphila]UUX48611.1 hypothetical protein NUH88_14475 [Nisaea acidiphila]